MLRGHNKDMFFVHIHIKFQITLNKKLSKNKKNLKISVRSKQEAKVLQNKHQLCFEATCTVP